MHPKPSKISRRNFLAKVTRTTGSLAALTLSSCTNFNPFKPAVDGNKMKFGLVTYLWAKDWDLPKLIINCRTAEVFGVELRTQHAHGVEDSLSANERKEVKKRFADSPVTLVGLGTNFAFHDPDPQKLKDNIEGAKRYIKLAQDVGASGVKVKPNAIPPRVHIEKTLEQIGTSLNEIGAFAADYGQEIRLEVHGRLTSKIPITKKILDYVDQPNVGACWNSNDIDLQGKGLQYNFNLLKDRLASTVHTREFNIGIYPYQDLINLFVGIDYNGWILLEARTKPQDRLKALVEQRMLFEQMVAKAQTIG
ncbi:MAG: sugar phosphate isomerase/epimerase family protein [Planctomycetota bacterium]|jgi:sugar phosphate isomerase/epimerase